jgi:hypothetical protein
MEIAKEDVGSYQTGQPMGFLQFLDETQLQSPAPQTVEPKEASVGKQVSSVFIFFAEMSIQERRQT